MLFCQDLLPFVLEIFYSNGMVVAEKTPNPEQKNAIETIYGPLLVLAGPGTGKTQLLSYRIAYLLKQTDTNPKNILVLTFTEAGVSALKERALSLIGPVSCDITISTFHGLASEIISAFPHVFNVSYGGHIDELERFELVESLISDPAFRLLRPLRSPDYYITEIAKTITTAKREAITPEAIKTFADELKIPKKQIQKEKMSRQQSILLEFAQVFERYQKALRDNGRYDYEDMVVWATDALNNNSEVRDHYQEKYQFILVDEYQDTNTAQNILIESLSNFFDTPNICVVGDDKQAIYRFQGASVANMIHFVKKYPKLQIISLRENYRNAKDILSVADELISNNRHQIQSYLPSVTSLLRPQAKDDGYVEVVACQNKYAEYEQILETIKKRRASGVADRDIAVVWRKNSDVVSFSQFLVGCDIPVISNSVTDALTHPYGQIVITVLEAVATLEDKAVFAAVRLLLTPELLPTFYALPKKVNERLIEQLKEHLASPELKNLAGVILQLHQQALTSDLPTAVQSILSKQEWFNHLEVNHLFWRVVATFLELASRYSQEHPAGSLSDWLTYLAQSKKRGIRIPLVVLDEGESGVTVSTVHGVKGLEFDTVCIAGLDERRWSLRESRNLIPLPAELISLRNWTEDVVEDERRLLYVALTRAKYYLSLSYHVKSDDGFEQLPCRFLSELGSNYIPLKRKSTGDDAIRQTVFSPKNSLPLADESLRWIRSKLSTASVSFTDLEMYKKCPRQYLIRRIFRFPETGSASLAYGNAVHRALEIFFKTYRNTQTIPSLDLLLKTFSGVLDTSMRYSDIERQLELGSAVLGRYYEKILAHSSVPYESERSFTKQQIKLPSGVPITGKIDLIERISGDNVRVVDFKTATKAKSRNEILGATKTSDGRYFRQLVFYSLLLENDPNFSFYPKEFTIRFIDDEMRFTEYDFDITEHDRNVLSHEIEKTYRQILSDEQFPHTGDGYNDGCENCALAII